MNTLSKDGYVRLALDRFLSEEIVHLYSGIEQRDFPNDELTDNSGSVIGYTEWVSVRVPTISVGWDWRFDRAGHQNKLIAVGYPRSNLMLMHGRGAQLGQLETEKLLKNWLEFFDWQIPVCQALHLPNPDSIHPPCQV